MIDKPTASSLERASECPASCTIPIRVHTSGDAAERGAEIHGYIEAVLEQHQDPKTALAIVPEEWRETCAALDWEELLRGFDRDSIRVESAYALDLERGCARGLGRSLGRVYPPTSQYEIAGTNDIEGDRVNGIPGVQDNKTGQPVAACSGNWQMRYHALIQHLVTGAPDILARLTYIEESGKVYHDAHAFDPADHADTLDEIRDVMQRVRAAEASEIVRVAPGEWCRYCECLSACPAYTGLARNMVAELSGLEAKMATLTIEQVGEVWQKVKMLEPILDAVARRLKDYVLATPGTVLLPDGRLLRKIPKSRGGINATAAFALAENLGASPNDLAAVMTRSHWVEVRACKPPQEKKPARAKKEKAA